MHELNVRIVRPFDQTDLPMLRVTQAEEGVAREVQAHSLAACLEDALSADLGGRMNRVFLKLTALAIEQGRPWTDVLRWLESPERLARDGAKSADPSIREYAVEGFRRENRASIEALTARLDTFLFLEETRLCLNAPACINFQDCLNSGLTIIDVGDPPAGAERVARFWASVLVGRLTRAILSRQVHERSARAWVLFEEFQEGLGRSQIEQFGRILALARYKKVSLTYINQQAGQVAAVDPGLVRILRTNTGLEAAFRCNLDDARSFAHALPLPGDVRSVAAARQVLTEEMTRLPDRTYYLWLKQAPFHAHRLKSPHLDLKALREAVEAVPATVRDAIARGSVTLPRRELEAAMRQGRQDGPREGAMIPVCTPAAPGKASGLVHLG